jgi:hypothetical protein
MQYWDTSTLLKLYVPEPDSQQFAAHVAPPGVHASELARWELMRAIARKEMEHAIPAMSSEAVFSRFLADVSARRVLLVPFDAAIESRFRHLVLQLHRRQPPVVIRTLDAIHLPSADLLPAAEVVSTDPHMRAGATAIGLKIFP